MVQMWRRAAILAALGAVALAVTVIPSAIADDKNGPSIEEIMKAGHKGKGSLFAKTQAAVKAGKWEDAHTAAKTLAENGAALPKHKPHRGSAESWATLAKAYAENTKAVADATEKKDAAAAKTAMSAIGGSCKACHMAHRGKGK